MAKKTSNEQIDPVYQPCWNTAEEVYVSMGYRKLDSKVPMWGKPIGWSILIIDLRAKPRILQNFYGVNGQMLVWSSADLNPADLVELETAIKGFEEYTMRTGLNLRSVARLNFIPHSDRIAMML